MPFKTPEALESALALLQGTVEDELKAHCYNTIGSFLAFYKAFKNSKSSFYHFFRNYQPSVISESLSCVGLSFALIKSLQASKYGIPLSKYLFVASCEEWTDKSDLECQNSPSENDLKEHVLVALKFNLDGRFGVLLFDLGYHVTFPIIVMADESYPHTGTFLYSQTPKCCKEYTYTLSPGNKYVNWTIKETRNGQAATFCESYIYIHQRFQSAVQVVEKKCMVYNFRTIVARDANGPKAGFYCNFKKDESFTLFFNENASKRECKIPYTFFEGTAENNEYAAAIEACAAQCAFNAAYFTQVFKDVVKAFRDSSFTPFMKCVNDILEGEIDNAVRE